MIMLCRRRKSQKYSHLKKNFPKRIIFQASKSYRRKKRRRKPNSKRKRRKKY